MAVRRVVVLLNPGSGSFNKMPESALRATIEHTLAEHNVAAQIVTASGADLRAAAESALAQFRAGDIDAIAVGGGDGSVRTVAGVLAETDAPLAVIPLGTLNHLAKDLGVPLTVSAAAATIATGQVRTIDIAEVNGEAFVNTSSIGIYPYMVIDRERRRSTHKLAKWVAMVPAFIRVLRHFPRRRLRLHVEGLARPYRTPCLFVGNNEYDTDLFAFGRRTCLDGGALCFYVLKPSNAWELFLTVCRLCLGRPDPERDLDTFRLSEARIDAKTSRLPVSLDGEVLMLHPPLHYRLKPRALRVITPAD